MNKTDNLQEDKTEQKKYPSNTSNLDVYNSVRSVPKEAQKLITGGRLTGKTDINPMWRIKTLTEMHGACGFGWYYKIKKQWLEQGANGEVAAFCNITLFVKHNGEWSKGIAGTGGSTYIQKEKTGLYTNDECFKMALTDAISVSCKSIGIGADVYWQADSTKYNEKIADAKSNEAYANFKKLQAQIKSGGDVDWTKAEEYFKQTTFYKSFLALKNVK